VGNSINIHGLQDPNQVQTVMLEERNRLNQRREVAMPNIKVSGPRRRLILGQHRPGWQLILLEKRTIAALPWRNLWKFGIRRKVVLF
jgi:hypothetical protein